MRERSGTGPRGVRWVAGGLAAFVLTLAIAWVLFVPAADWLAHHDVGSAKGSALQTARDDARGRLLTLGAGVFAGGALAYTARNFSLSRRTFDLTMQGQVTDRYTKAIEQLGSDKVDVRIGGIYALEHVARDSPRDHPTVMEVLSAFIREHSREPWPPSSPEHGRDAEPRLLRPRPDVQAAATVIGRRITRYDSQPVNLAGANLFGADLTHAKLSLADLSGVDLRRARLNSADLSHARLRHADLTFAKLHGATLTDAYLRLAKLRNAELPDAKLNSADLSDAGLTRAQLQGADLTGADLTDADLTDAHLNGAHLDGAQLTGTDFTRADLIGVSLPAYAKVPQGWERGPGSGGLRRADSDPAGPAAS